MNEFRKMADEIWDDVWVALYLQLLFENKINSLVSYANLEIEHSITLLLNTPIVKKLTSSKLDL